MAECPNSLAQTQYEGKTDNRCNNRQKKLPEGNGATNSDARDHPDQGLKEVEGFGLQ